MLCVDVHSHFFPSDLDKSTLNQRVGWKTPQGTLPWSPESSLKAMDDMGVDLAILSLPAFFIGSICEENRTQARRWNNTMASIVRDHPTRFAFFGCVPFLDDIEGVLQEISYALDVLHAVGISISSSYGIGPDAKYIGDDHYDPIWAELDRRRAVAFLHGTQVSMVPDVHPLLCVPIAQVPHETFKAAAHLVVTGRKRKYPDVQIILSHLGGATPMLAPRIAVLSSHMGSALTPEEILEDFRSYYYETALSSLGSNMACMDAFVSPSRLLFGSDFPAVNVEMANWYTKNIKEHYAEDSGRLKMVMGGNAFNLFPILRDRHWSQVSEDDSRRK